jgi:hypothetical protein
MSNAKHLLKIVLSRRAQVPNKSRAGHCPLTHLWAIVTPGWGTRVRQHHPVKVTRRQEK